MSSGPEIYCCAMRAKPGKEAELLRLFEIHSETLRHAGLLTDRPALVMRADDGTLIEFAEWNASDASAKAHDHPEVGPLWEKMAEAGDHVALANLPAAKETHPHFHPVDIRQLALR